MSFRKPIYQCQEHTLIIPLKWSCTHPTILVRLAGPHTGQVDQDAARHLDGQGKLLHRRLLPIGADPGQWTGETSLSESLPTSTHRYLPN
jgi:hypothetical protein